MLSNTTNLRFRYFQIMWLVFILFHMIISSPSWTVIGNDFLNPSNHFFLITNILVVLCCLISLFQPKKLLFFWLTIIFLTVVKLDALPSVPNHIILTLIIHFTIFLSLFLYWDPALELKDRIAQWFDKTAPYLRVELLILYFFVVLHKINYDFFDPSVSCSAELYTDIAGIYPFLPDGLWISWIMIGTTFLLEMAIPILLIIPSTRILAVFIGLIFHFMLSLHPNLYILSFTAELYALYILFLPEKTIDQIHSFLKQRIESINIKKVFAVLTGGSFLAVMGYIITKIILQGGLTASLLNNAMTDIFKLVPVIWIIWCLLIILAASVIFFRGEYSIPKSSSIFKLSWSPLLLFPLLTVFNGITPYIGLKTATNFAMFSNLMVSGSDNNHIFMTSDYQVSDIQNDSVTLLSSNHPYLQGFIERNEYITYFELSRFLYQNRSENIQVTFLRNGKKQTIDLPQQEANEWLESSWLARKLLIFRGVPESGPTPCQW